MAKAATPEREHRHAVEWPIMTAAALLIAAALLLWAGARHPYSYYQVLRWIVTIAWVLSAWRFYALGWTYAVLLCAPFVILFNPISPIYMRKWQWQPYDHVTAVASVAAAIILSWVGWRQRLRQANN